MGCHYQKAEKADFHHVTRNTFNINLIISPLTCIHRNTTGKLGLHVCHWSGDLWLKVWRKEFWDSMIENYGTQKISHIFKGKNPQFSSESFTKDIVNGLALV